MSWIRSFRDFRFRSFYWLLTRRFQGLERLGGTCTWTINPAELGPSSTVLCAGAGNDISFEKALIERFGCRVILLDPSPTGKATFGRDLISDPALLSFLPYGLAGEDGTFSFTAPEDPAEGSFSATRRSGNHALDLECKSVPTLMAQLGWKRIDLLKMDIEGFEYGVLESLDQNKIDVRQICVEFHHGAGFRATRSDTIKAILNLRRSGMTLVHRVHFDHTFCKL